MPQEQRQEGLQLLEVAVKACKIQAKNGNGFILEHPAGASSWDTEVMQDLVKMDGVTCVTFDMCMLGLRSRDRQGEAPARKTTRVPRRS